MNIFKKIFFSFFLFSSIFICLHERSNIYTSTTYALPDAEYSSGFL